MEEPAGGAVYLGLWNIDQIIPNGPNQRQVKDIGEADLRRLRGNAAGSDRTTCYVVSLASDWSALR